MLWQLLVDLWVFMKSMPKGYNITELVVMQMQHFRCFIGIFMVVFMAVLIKQKKLYKLKIFNQTLESGIKRRQKYRDSDPALTYPRSLRYANC